MNSFPNKLGDKKIKIIIHRIGIPIGASGITGKSPLVWTIKLSYDKVKLVVENGDEWSQ